MVFHSPDGFDGGIFILPYNYLACEEIQASGIHRVNIPEPVPTVPYMQHLRPQLLVHDSNFWNPDRILPHLLSYSILAPEKLHG